MAFDLIHWLDRKILISSGFETQGINELTLQKRYEYIKNKDNHEYL